MKILVCGGRDFSDAEMMASALARVTAGKVITEVIHGAARGADSLAGSWAKERGIPVRVFPANWKRDGKAAGPIRNALMLTEGKPDMVIAFPGGKGTADMVRKSEAANIHTVEDLANLEWA